MKIKPVPDSWGFTEDYCCYAFFVHTYSGEITTDGEHALLDGKAISFCPYCGGEIKLEKVK